MVYTQVSKTCAVRIVGSSPTLDTGPGGVMAATQVLGTCAERRVGSSPTLVTVWTVS